MNKYLKRLKNQKGVTLVELLAVLVIIGIIAAIAIPAISNIIRDSQDKAILADASTVLQAGKLAYANGEYTRYDETQDKYRIEADILNKYLEKDIDLSEDSDVVIYYARDGENIEKGWEITYTKLKDIKNKERFRDFSQSQTITEEELNKLLKGD